MLLKSKRFWKRAGYVGLILLALVVILYCGVSIWANRLAARIARLRAAGEPTCIADLAPPAGQGQNGADIIAGVSQDIRGFTKEEAQFYITDLGKSYSEKKDRRSQPSTEEINAIRAILEKYPRIEPALQQAVTCEYFRSRLNYALGFQQFLNDLIKRATDLRSCARMLDWKTQVELADGNIDQAMKTGMLVLRLSRLQEQEPALQNGLVAIAIRAKGVDLLNLAIRSGPVSKEQRDALDDELATLDGLDWYVNVLKTERAVNLSAARDQFPLFPMTWQGTLLQADMIGFYEQFLPLAAQPAYLSVEKISALEKKSYSTPISTTLIKLLFPAIEAANISANRNLVSIRCLRILNALGRYREEHGEEATGLDDLSLPSESTIDPFDGKPLKLRLTDSGWVIYSVGQDGIDDGGELSELQDRGLAPVGYGE